jgi:hypothetical protein
MDNPRNKLDWLAFRYIANELDESERVEFEEQLATDQHARETVARMVQMSASISTCCSDKPRAASTSSQAAWSRSAVRWSTVGVGLSLVLLVALFAYRGSLPLPDSIGQDLVVTPLATSDLAYAWAETRAPADLIDLESEAFGESLETLWRSDDDEEVTEDALVAPSWMLAAVAGIDHGPDSDVDTQE